MEIGTDEDEADFPLKITHIKITQMDRTFISICICFFVLVYTLLIPHLTLKMLGTLDAQYSYLTF